jgi:hypothetical protein
MQLGCQNQYRHKLSNFQAFESKLQSSGSLLAGKVCHGRSSICRFRVGDCGSILRSQESQPHAHFFLIVFDDGLKQRDQIVLSLRVLFCPDLSAERANQIDVIHGECDAFNGYRPTYWQNPARKYSHFAFLWGIRE